MLRVTAFSFPYYDNVGFIVWLKMRATEPCLT